MAMSVTQRASSLTLFDVPKLARDCIDRLRRLGIGRVQFKSFTVINGRMQVHLVYFHALDSLNAEIDSRGCDALYGVFFHYRLVVNESCELVWVKWQRDERQRGRIC